jgi:hypothetical protein
LEVQANQIAHRKLAVPGCIDHILEAGRFNEQVLAIGEHLVGISEFDDRLGPPAPA